MQMCEVEQLIFAIISAIGVGRILKIIASASPQDEVQAILDAEYAAAAQAALAAANEKFGK